VGKRAWFGDRCGRPRGIGGVTGSETPAKLTPMATWSCKTTAAISRTPTRPTPTAMAMETSATTARRPPTSIKPMLTRTASGTPANRTPATGPPAVPAAPRPATGPTMTAMASSTTDVRSPSANQATSTATGSTTTVTVRSTTAVHVTERLRNLIDDDVIERLGIEAARWSSRLSFCTHAIKKLPLELYGR